MERPFGIGQVNLIVRMHHARILAPGGTRIELDSIAFARHWNPGLNTASGNGGCVLFLSVAGRADVDQLFQTATRLPRAEIPRGCVLGRALCDRRGSGRSRDRLHE